MPSGFTVPQRRHDALLAKTWSAQLGQIQSPGLPSGGCVVGTPSGFGVPQRRHAGFRAKTMSPQPVHVQSPGFGTMPGTPPPKLAATPAPLISIPAAPGMVCATCVAKAALPLAAAWVSGRGVVHFRHVMLRANCTSPQHGHFQSPCLIACGSPGNEAETTPAKSAGFGAPHFRQLTFLANWRSPQVLHVQSPGFTGYVWPGGAETCAMFMGFAVPHLRQDALRANWWSPQPGQAQSPGKFFIAPATPPQAPNMVASIAAAAGAAPPSTGRGVPQRRQFEFRKNWRSPHPGHIQSPSIAPFIPTASPSRRRWRCRPQRPPKPNRRA
mmetsp:Transcript_72528/g.201126  ORF Transcript_72528/g.201126 Transcript_72528/m.201126 type:complete len:326 (-) Transcript_72528:2-979(-)